MEHVCDQLVLLSCVSHLKLNLAVAIEPGKSPVRVFCFEEAIEPLCTHLQLVGDLALGRIHLWPGTIGENLSDEFNTSDGVSINVICELGLHLARQSDVLKHLSHLLDLVCTALHLQLLNHDLLVLPRD